MRVPIRDEISGQLGCRIGRIIWLYFSLVEPQILHSPFHLRGEMPIHFKPWGHLAKMNPGSLLLSDAQHEKLEQGSWVCVCDLHTHQSWCLIHSFFKQILTSRRCCELGSLWEPIKSPLKIGLKIYIYGFTCRVKVRQVWSFVSFGERRRGLISSLSSLFTMVLRVSFHWFHKVSKGFQVSGAVISVKYNFFFIKIKNPTSEIQLLGICS